MPVVDPRTAGEQPQPVGQPGLEPVEPQRREPGRGQLDRQRHAVQGAADRGDPRPVRLGEHRAAGRGAPEEQLDRVTGAAVRCDGEPGHRRTPTRTAPAAGPGWWRAPPAGGCRRAGARAGPPRRPAGARSCPGPAAPRASPARRGSCPSADRPCCSPRPSASAIAGAIIAGSVTGTRSTYQDPSANRSLRSAATLSASRVLPTPPGPTAVTSRCSCSASASAARSAARPTNGVNGSGRAPVTAATGPASGSAAAGLWTPARRERGERPAVAHLQLAQQRGDVALDGADRDEQPGADLGVGQVLAEGGEHLRLAGRDARVGQCGPAVHPPIVLRTRAAVIAGSGARGWDVRRVTVVTQPRAGGLAGSTTAGLLAC